MGLILNIKYTYGYAQKPTTKNLYKAVKFVREIYNNRKASSSYKEFINDGKGDSKDSSHRLRLLHDQFLQDSYKNHCVGTIYRTDKARTTINGIEDQKSNATKNLLKLEKGWGVHCEHVIPNNILTKHLFYEDKTEREVHQFIYFNRVICAIHNDEKEALNKKRLLNNRTSTWSSSHPAFEMNDKCTGSFQNIKPFERYQGTHLHVHCILTNEEINFATFTMSQHYDILNKYQSDILDAYNTSWESFER